jgi:uncharacterized Fe-S cluster protein YjdI
LTSLQTRFGLELGTPPTRCDPRLVRATVKSRLEESGRRPIRRREARVTAMSTKRKPYRAQDIVVYFEPRRCLHTGECLRAVPEVFDNRKTPWINPGAAEPDRVAEAVRRCPTGALHFERLDGGEAETAPARTTVTIMPDGPLFVRGDLEIRRGDGTVLGAETRVALCRCGHSRTKPFCDNSHFGAGFEAE